MIIGTFNAINKIRNNIVVLILPTKFKQYYTSKKMKIVLFGDSITDMGRDRTSDFSAFSYGHGYSNVIASQLLKSNPLKYEIYNHGISGDRTVDLYARLKRDVWNVKPDVLSILVGINDVWHDLGENPNGVDIVRYEKVYRMMIEETKDRLPDLKFILAEPFVLKCTATEEKYNMLLKVKDYAKVVKRLAEEYSLHFLPLQKKLDEAAEKFGADKFLYDGIHPSLAGAGLIADEWLNLFKNKIEN